MNMAIYLSVVQHPSGKLALLYTITDGKRARGKLIPLNSYTKARYKNEAGGIR